MSEDELQRGRNLRRQAEARKQARSNVLLAVVAAATLAAIVLAALLLRGQDLNRLEEIEETQHRTTLAGRRADAALARSFKNRRTIVIVHRKVIHVTQRVSAVEGEVKEALAQTALPEGAPGMAGSAGAIGPPGPKGAQGPSGAPGKAGEAGPQGTPGERGEAGEKGAQGAQGERGAQGEAGAPGEAGPEGAQGVPGPEGPPGPQGPLGPPGEVNTAEIEAIVAQMISGTTVACEAHGQEILCSLVP